MPLRRRRPVAGAAEECGTPAHRNACKGGGGHLTGEVEGCVRCCDGMVEVLSLVNDSAAMAQLREGGGWNPAVRPLVQQPFEG
jgi:hypothetical protein